MTPLDIVIVWTCCLGSFVVLALITAHYIIKFQNEYKKENKNMGYQEMLIKTKTSQIQKIKEQIKSNGMHFFIDLVGYYKPKYESKYIYLVTSGDRHPGADFVHTEFGGQPIDEIFDFEEILVHSGNFEFIRLSEKGDNA